MRFRLQPIMASRLVLNLSSSAKFQNDSRIQSQSNLEHPVFASNSILGNIGAPLRVDSNDEFGVEFTDAEGILEVVRMREANRENEIEEEINV